MELYSPIEPLRRFQTDHDYKAKLESFKKNFDKHAPVNHGNTSLRPFSLQLNIPLNLVKNERDMQGALYKNHESLHKELLFVDFWYNSRQIFQFDNKLSDALLQTDIYDVPWSEIKLPHKDFYISFGSPKGEPFALANGWEYMVDGAYVKFVEAGQSVIYNESSIMIDFTTRLINPDYKTAIEDDSLPGTSFSEPIYSFVLSGEPADTVKDAIERGEMNNIQHCDEMDRLNYEQALIYSKETGVTGMEDFHAHFIRERYFRGRDFILPSLNVLFNCIFYMIQYPDNIYIRYNDHRAKVLYKTLDRTKEIETKNKIKKEIDKSEYTRIRLVKDDKVVDLFNSIPTGKEIRTHWRRGHWRNQAYGEMNLLHKFKWIHPTIVNKDKGNPETGHLYEIGNSESVNFFV